MNKVKRFLKYLVLIVLIFPSFINALEYPSVNSENVIVYDLTDEKMMYALNEDEKTSIASLTKIMTAIVAIENIEDLDETVTITSSMLSTVSWDASTAGLRVGDEVTYRDLLYAVMLPSGADATNSLAILISGSIDEYVDLMNEKASELGMDTTHFVNTTGLDHKEHYSSATDVLTLIKYALENDVFKEIFTTKLYTLTNGLKVKSSLDYYNRNMNLDVSKILGSKTGFTDDAGYSILVYFKSSDHDMVAITLDAPYKDNKFYNLVDARNLIDFVDENYGYEFIITSEDVVKDVSVKFGNIDTYEVKVLEDVQLFLAKDYDKDKIEIRYDGFSEISYKNKMGEKLGIVEIYYENELMYSEEVFLEEEIKLNVFKVILEYKFYIIGACVVLILIKFSFRRKKKKRIRKR